MEKSNSQIILLHLLVICNVYTNFNNNNSYSPTINDINPNKKIMKFLDL